MYKIFSVDGSKLAEEIAIQLEPDDYSKILGKFKVDKFSDGELSPQFLETIRNKKVFLVSSTTTPEKILILLLAIDAAKRASASEIIVILPYFGYSRQDRKEGARGAIGAKLMADLIQTAGATRIITIDLHSEQIQGFFNLPVTLIPGHVAFNKVISELPVDNYVVCSPDAGGVKRATRFYRKFIKRFPETTFAMLSKLRDKPNSIERMDLIGEVNNKTVILFDDMVDTAGTLTTAATLLKNAGARKVLAFLSHGVLSGPGSSRIEACKELDAVYITNTIPQLSTDKIIIASCAHVIAIAINSILHSFSLDSSLDNI